MYKNISYSSLNENKKLNTVFSDQNEIQKHFQHKV